MDGLKEILRTIEQLARRVRQLEAIEFPVASGETGAPSPHALDSIHHSGTLANDQAPQFLLVDGSRDLEGNLAVDDGITVDGVDISLHASQDAQTAHGTLGVHAHSDDASGGLIDHDNLDNVTADQHHDAFVGLDSDMGIAYPNVVNLVTVSGGSGITTVAGPGFGLPADELQVSVDLTDAWSGLEFATGELQIDQDAEFHWTADHAWNPDPLSYADVLAVDESELAVYINVLDGLIAPPTVTGAFVVTSATNTQTGAVIATLRAQTADMLQFYNTADDLVELRVTSDTNFEGLEFTNYLKGFRIGELDTVRVNYGCIRSELLNGVLARCEAFGCAGQILVHPAGQLYAEVTTID